ncbi:unnamed protein product [Rotaria sp. Silwood1]|nr:unnamed protein product [Rotaria sp. Silwood1]CAF0861751.1 unnamed protein product [Rotaria sp. Silwood1]CAF3364935.1 unnamed protein product [Rotaria sp. Silwood1]CAF3382926.1 unnamed protein product [Rotaria sp. Silwood1]CAF3385740.1 unnamed protein product [Rotaria sp. Silwood1]
MQHDSSEIIYNNQSNFLDNRYSLTNPPSYETYAYQPYPGPPPCSPDSKQSINNTEHTVSSAQYYGHVLLHPQNSILVVPAHHILMNNRSVTTITLQLRVFFILSGIAYLLWGALAIGLEISLLLYSYSIYYRGIFLGFVMLGTSISMLIIAFQISHLMIYMVRLLFFLVIFSLLGIILSVADVCLLQKCVNSVSEDLCDAPIGYTLKVIILIKFFIVTIQTGINLLIVRRVKKKSTSMPPVANTSDHQY